jgi:2,4-dichlorophenol 6-monooxygenase
VNALVRNLDDDSETRIRARYVIAADAGKTIGPALGIRMVGADNVATYVSVHFAADLSKYISEQDAVMRVIFHPRDSCATMRVGALLTLGPDHWDGRSEEWAVSWADPPSESEETPDRDEILKRVRKFLKIDVPIDVRFVSRWALGATIADRFRSERLFLIGDAAHKHSPNGGLGLNSGIQDAHNLCWKLALVLRGRAGEALLDTYESERRPVVTANGERALFGATNSMIAIGSLGALPNAPDDNETQFQRLLADDFDGARRRQRMHEVFRITRGEYAGHDQELGFTYPVGAVLDDGSPAAVRDVMGSVYTPTTRPGSRLPHAWLQRDGRVVSTHDLVPVDGFLVLTGAQGDGWKAAARLLAAQAGVAVAGYRIGGAGADLTDPGGAWREVCGIDEGGVLLIRPDGHVAYRAATNHPNPAEALRAAFRKAVAVHV